MPITPAGSALDYNGDGRPGILFDNLEAETSSSPGFGRTLMVSIRLQRTTCLQVKPVMIMYTSALRAPSGF